MYLNRSESESSRVASYYHKCVDNLKSAWLHKPLTQIKCGRVIYVTAVVLLKFMMIPSILLYYIT